MRITQKKPFMRGICMLISFAILFCLIMLPLMPGENGERLTGLQYADEVFNELSKGSSYFIPQARQASDSMLSKDVSLTVKLASSQQALLAAKLLETAGSPQPEISGSTLSFHADLGKILAAATEDSDNLFNNRGEIIEQKYNVKPLQVSAAWWHLLNPAIRELQKQKLISEAKAVDQVIRRAVEPGNNFYGIPSKQVSQNMLLLILLLLFYVAYTIWYGFGIYEIFDGLGLMGASTKNKKTNQ